MVLLPQNYDQNQNDTRYNHVIVLLQDYMLTPDHFNQNDYIVNKKINENKPENKPVRNVPIVEKVAGPNIFFPKETDSLFWCYYIVENNQLNYDLVKNNIFTTESQYKINFITKLKEKKAVLKSAKLKAVDIEAELVNCSKITIKGLEALCIINNVNVFFVWDNKYYEIMTNSDDPMSVIIEKMTPLGIKYGIIQDSNVDTLIEKYCQTHWKVDNPQKIIKAIGSYKIAELHTLCNKLNIPITVNGKKIVKKKLYDCILHKL